MQKPRCWVLFLLLIGLHLASPVDAQQQPQVDVRCRDVARWGSIAELRKILGAKPDLSSGDMSGTTPLHNAAESQSGEKVTLLLEAGADVNIRDNRGQTPLHRIIAMGKRWQPAVDALLNAKGIDVDAADVNGRTLLVTASTALDLANASRLLAMGAKDSLHAAAARGDVGAMKSLLDAGTDVGESSTVDNNPFPIPVTALMVASRAGRLDALELLLSKGARVDQADANGKTALMAAAHGGQMEAINRLLAAGADMNVADRYEMTFVDFATVYVRDRNGHETEKVDALTKLVLADARAKPPLRAAALLIQADVARDPKQAEIFYRKAIAEAPRTHAGITAAVNAANLLKKQDRYAESADVLKPLLVDNVIERGPLGEERIVWKPRIDMRHHACVEIAEAYIKLKRYDDALPYARLARDKFTYFTTCGTGLEDYLKAVDQRVKNLEQAVRVAPRERARVK